MSGAKSLVELSREIAKFKQALPPVHNWRPESDGHIDIFIDQDGHWLHEGKLIEREALVVLLASILRRDGPRDYALVTPVERLAIAVADVPFAVVDVERADRGRGRPVWSAVTSLGERVLVDVQHPIRAGDRAVGERGAAYCVIRPPHPSSAAPSSELEGRLTRAAWYRLAEVLDVDEKGAHLYSGGTRHYII